MDLTILYMENLGVVVRSKYLSQVLAVGVGDENLPETVALYQLHNPLHPFAIQPVENIVEEQDRLSNVQTLCQFHRQHEGALLTLAADLLKRVITEFHFQLVFVNTLTRPTEYQIALSRLHVRFA